MNAALKIPPRDQIGDNTPLRLDVAAIVAYPDGSMTGRGLRREYRRGYLVIERVAGKDYTTLAHIERMRTKCQLADKEQDSGCAKQGTTNAASSLIPPSGSLSTDAISKARAAASMIAGELSSSSRNTSRASTSIKRRRGNVVHLKSL
jgi:hypothetical protein